MLTKSLWWLSAAVFMIAVTQPWTDSGAGLAVVVIIGGGTGAVVSLLYYLLDYLRKKVIPQK
jgi:hypothetical protein